VLSGEKQSGTCLCHGTSTRRQRNDLCELQVKLPPATTCLYPLSALPKDTTSKLAGLTPC